MTYLRRFSRKKQAMAFVAHIFHRLLSQCLSVAQRGRNISQQFRSSRLALETRTCKFGAGAIGNETNGEFRITQGSIREVLRVKGLRLAVSPLRIGENR